MVVSRCGLSLSLSPSRTHTHTHTGRNNKPRLSGVCLCLFKCIGGGDSLEKITLGQSSQIKCILYI